jgi:hypothetical protein
MSKCYSERHYHQLHMRLGNSDYLVVLAGYYETGAICMWYSHCGSTTMLYHSGIPWWYTTVVVPQCSTTMVYHTGGTTVVYPSGIPEQYHHNGGITLWYCRVAEWYCCHVPQYHYLRPLTPTVPQCLTTIPTLTNTSLR